MDRITHLDDWAALTDAAPLPQHWAYGLAMQRLGAGVSRFVLSGQPVQTLERPGVRLIHRLPPDMALSPLARHAGLTVVSTAATGNRLIPLITARRHALWDVTAIEPTLLARMRPTWRHALEKASSPVRADKQALEAILHHAQVQGRARGYRNLPPDFVRHWPGGVLVLATGAPLTAGAVFLLHGPNATYHAAWSSPEGLATGAPRAILWRAAQTFAARGIRSIDLGAFDAANPGLARFKLGTGARRENLGPTSLLLPF